MAFIATGAAAAAAATAAGATAAAAAAASAAAIAAATAAAATAATAGATAAGAIGAGTAAAAGGGLLGAASTTAAATGATAALGATTTGLSGATAGLGMGAGSTLGSGTASGLSAAAQGFGSGAGGLSGGSYLVAPELGAAAAEAAPAVFGEGLLGADGISSSLMQTEMPLANSGTSATVTDMSTPAGWFDQANFATEGLLGNATDAVGGYAQPAMQAMSAAQTAQSLMPEEQPVTASPITPPVPSNNLNELAGQGAQLDMQRQQAEEQRRMAQMQRIRMMMGG